MPAASLTKVDTTSQSWLVLPKTQGITGYRCVCLSRAAQLQSWGLAVSLVSLSQACCMHRRHSCATSAFCAIEAVHRKVCWLTCCVRKDRRLNTDLRFASPSKLVPVAGPTVTYGPYCILVQKRRRRGSKTGFDCPPRSCAGRGHPPVRPSVALLNRHNFIFGRGRSPLKHTAPTRATHAKWPSQSRARGQD